MNALPTKVLIANRGEIAVRVIRTLSKMGIASAAVYSDVDSEAMHRHLADEAIAIVEPRAYLDIERIIDAAKSVGAQAIHPGYGFLAENPLFAEACKDAEIVLLGPSAEAMRAFGDKRTARVLAEKVGVPVVPGAQRCDSPQEAKASATELGFPVLLKAAAGGGGKGMRRVEDAAGIAEGFAAAQREAEASFGDGRLLVEKYIYPARHVEVQILGDGKSAVAVGDRECSLQRRYQKVVEEAPCAAISEKLRQELFSAATLLVSDIGYVGAGTVEFLVTEEGSFYFLEVNTRLQVEHPVTEWLTGMDLVEWQIQLAHGAPLPQPPTSRGHAIEVRLNAEDPYAGYMPDSGEISMLRWPQMPFIRIDSGIAEGVSISPHYDSMIAKITAWGETREEARRRMLTCLEQTVVLGLKTNQHFLAEILRTEFYTTGKTFTTTLEDRTWEAPKMPQWLEQLGEEQADKGPLLSGPRGNGSAGSSSMGAEQFSPWQSLGSFRNRGVPCG